MLQGDMETENYMTNPDLISNITIVVDEKTVYNISTSPFISRDPSFKFSFRGKIKNNQASIFITYNDGRQTKGHIKLQKLKYKSIGGQLLWSQMEPTKYTLPKNSRTINNKGWREKRPELASWLSLMSYEPSSFVRITKIDSAIVEIVEKFLFVCKCVFTLYPNVRSIHRVLFLSVQITRLYCRQF